MNSFTFKLFRVTLFIVLFVEYASSIACYECEGFGTNAACRNSLDASMIRVCPYPDSFCGYVKLDYFWFFYTKRACGKKFDGNDDILNDYAKRTGLHVTTTMCTTNLCNKHVDPPTRMIIFICAMLILSLLFTCLFISMKKRWCC